jgi:hypothetical protein
MIACYRAKSEKAGIASESYPNLPVILSEAKNLVPRLSG